MKCNEIDKRKTRNQMNLNNLDRALHDLGMLSVVTEARRDFLESKSDLCMMRLNTRYVSNVTLGYCMKRTTAKNRLCPYIVPVRHRTKSENSDAVSDGAEGNREFKNSLLEPSTSGYNRDSLADVGLCAAKRCQSLENLNLSTDTVQCSETSQDMERVSTQIQKLQVDE